jgi:dethiobiotin synthetase
MATFSLSRATLTVAKQAFSTRRVDIDAMRTLINGPRQPQPGDLVMARVQTIGQHKRLQLSNGRPAQLFEDDMVIVAYGHRYAPDQFEAETPPHLDACHLVAAGGIAAQVLSQHGAMARPTGLQPLGLIGDQWGRPLNLRNFALPAVVLPIEIPILAVVGTCMNSGKTTAAAHLIHGLCRAGHRVGAAKITGTGAPADVSLMIDAGAAAVLDFTDAGYASTYRVELPQLESIFSTLVGHLQMQNASVIVIEIADGLYQQETMQILESERFRASVSGVLMAAQDSLGATAGVNWLRARRLPVFGITGLLTRSPLATREATQATDLPVYSLDDLSDDRIAAIPGFPLASVATPSFRAAA